MKKLILIVVLFLSACNIGQFEPKRERLYDKGREICASNPERCIHGIPW